MAADGAIPHLCQNQIPIPSNPLALEVLILVAIGSICWGWQKLATT